MYTAFSVAVPLRDVGYSGEGGSSSVVLRHGPKLQNLKPSVPESSSIESSSVSPDASSESLSQTPNLVNSCPTLPLDAHMNLLL